MKRLVLFVLAIVCASAAFAADTAPQGWILSGTTPGDYAARTDKTQAHSGTSSGLLASETAAPRGFGTLLQSLQPDAYRGKRVRFTAFIRSEDIAKWAGMWFRVDGAEGSPALAFDNMSDRPIKGTTEWKECSIVLDVPPEASAMVYGILLDGPGKVWIDSARFEVVDRSVPTTGKKMAASKPTEPVNLDFEL